MIALVAGFFAVPGRWWLGVLAAAVGLIAAGILVQHCVARFEGLNGDVLGAALEVSTTVGLVIVTFAGR